MNTLRRIPRIPELKEDENMWTHWPNKTITVVNNTGKEIEAKVIYFENVGGFVAAMVQFGGRKIRRLIDKDGKIRDNNKGFRFKKEKMETGAFV